MNNIYFYIKRYSIYISILIGVLIIYLILWRRNRVISYARTFIGDVQEVGNNAGFTDEQFEKLMKEYGDFRSGDPWCMSFVKMVWNKKTKGKYKQLLDKLMNPSTQSTFENFQKDTSGKFIVSKTPKRGSIMILQSYKNGVPQYKGHAGIVTAVRKDGYSTIEGNSNDDGSRNGYTVARQDRKFVWSGSNNMRIRGFITMKNLKY